MPTPGLRAMTGEELDELLRTERTCRVATVGADGTPHVAPLYFVWDGTSMWLNSLLRSKRWADVAVRPVVSVVVDAGNDTTDLHGAELVGEVAVVGEVPRAGEHVPELVEPERLFARKYIGVDELPHDGRHAWLRLTPTTIRTWDRRRR